MDGDKTYDSRFQRRPHLSKEHRVPKCFKEVEKIIRSVKSCKKNYKTELANSRLRGSAHKKVYSLTVNVLKNYNYIQKIIDKVQLLEKEKYLRREIASVLIYEMIFGNGTLPGESKVVATIQMHENDIRYAHEVLQSTYSLTTKDLNIPRYVRVHTLVTTVTYVINDLKSYGFKQILYEEDLPEEKFFELVRNLENGCFLVDFHFKDILVFEHSENLINLDLYKNGHIFLQDKSSYIPVHVLDPVPTSCVLDACAAPGIKTIHIASKMKNKGILYACERDKNRFDSLKQMLDYGSVKICRTLCKDFKLIDPNDQAYSSIEYILLDPSCSGSGMVNRLDEVTDTEDSKNKERLMKLAGFQIILLKHALKFPSVKRVVYSTCSIHEEENEYVVHEVLNACNGSFKLAAGMPEWSQRGSENFVLGKLCIRTIPEKHLTNGFFVAMFERINMYTEENYLSSEFKEEQMHIEKSENIHFGKFGSSIENQNEIPSKLGKIYEMETVSEISGGFSHNDSQFAQKNDGTDIHVVINKNARNIEDSNENVVDEQKNINLDYVQKKKHKKKKRNYTDLIDHEDTHNSQFQEKNEITNICDNVNKAVDTNECITGEQNPLNLSSAPQKNKHKKKKKKSLKRELLNESNELEQNVPKEPPESPPKNKKLKESLLSHDIYAKKDKCKKNQNQNSIEVTEQLADAAVLHKKKKKEHLEQEGTHTFQNKHSDKANELQQDLDVVLDPTCKLSKENNDVYLHNADCASRKDKYKQIKDSEEFVHVGIVEDQVDVAPLYKKKKKKKKHLNDANEVQQELLNTSHESSELMIIHDSNCESINKKSKHKQNKQCLSNATNSTEVIADFASIASLHKGKKSRAKHLDMECIQSSEMRISVPGTKCLNQSNIPSEPQHESSKLIENKAVCFNNVDSDNINIFTKKEKHKQNKLRVKNTLDSMEAIEDLSSDVLLHKKKKRKKKYLEAGDIQSPNPQVLLSENKFLDESDELKKELPSMFSESQNSLSKSKVNNDKTNGHLIGDISDCVQDVEDLTNATPSHKKKKKKKKKEYVET